MAAKQKQKVGSCQSFDNFCKFIIIVIIIFTVYITWKKNYGSQ